MSRRDRIHMETCLRKRRYVTWDDAEAAAMLVWLENPSPDHVNICGAYPCDVGDQRHYHYGHVQWSHRQREHRRHERQQVT